MYWYIVHVELGKGPTLETFFNKQEGHTAIIPKMEKWYNIKGKKEYIVTELYPDYVFIKSPLCEKEFKDFFKEFFCSINGFAKLLTQDEVISLPKEEQEVLELFFKDSDVFKHSIGNIVDSVLIVEEGPLVGLEDQVIKIDRHKRMATLTFNLFNTRVSAPLEVVSKS